MVYNGCGALSLRNLFTSAISLCHRRGARNGLSVLSPGPLIIGFYRRGLLSDRQVTHNINLRLFSRALCVSSNRVRPMTNSKRDAMRLFFVNLNAY